MRSVTRSVARIDIYLRHSLFLEILDGAAFEQTLERGTDIRFRMSFG